MDAKWAPVETGPHQRYVLYASYLFEEMDSLTFRFKPASPILAALTTQSQILISKSGTNQFEGPWRQVDCLTGGEGNHIVSMAWMAGDHRRAWLVAGTRKGEVIVWSMEEGDILLLSITKLVKGEITGLYWSQKDTLALVTPDQIHIAQVNRSDEGITFKSNTHQPPTLDGSSVSIARWQDSLLLYCTPGGVHFFEAERGAYKNLLLQDIGEEESCCLRPVVSIKSMANQEWEIMTQDGYRYSITQQVLSESHEFISPSGYLPTD